MTACVLDHPEPRDAEHGLLCLDHWSQLRCALLELPAIAGWLQVNLAAGGVAAETRVSGSREDPIPLRTDVLDLIGPDSRRRARCNPDDQLGDEAIRATLVHYTQAVHDTSRPFPPLTAVLFDGRQVAEYASSDEATEELGRLRWQGRRLVRPCRWQAVTVANRAGWADLAPLSSLVGYLAGHLSWIADQPWVDGFAVEVRQCGSRAHRLAPWRPEIRRDPDPCTRCGRRAVVLHLAAGKSRCERKAGGCGREQPLSEYVLNAVLPGTRRAS